MTTPDPGLSIVGTFERLRDAFFRYYDTPFGLSDRRLQQERRELLDRDGGIYRRPMVELRPEYVSAGQRLAESVRRAGASAELAQFAAAGIIPPGRALYEHQEKALKVGMQPGRNVVLTAGTGSGKTESFVLPILATLLQESARWSGAPASHRSWWTSDAPYAPQRDGEHGRSAAVRAIVLYPMNALVDDQLIRLRQALDSDGVRAWLDENRRGHRFYFGRFTGSTPVTGSPDNSLAVSELRRYLREVARRSDRAQEIGGEVSSFVPRLDGAEMRSRWDMLQAPPDILITNYSMLNVMLLRERDGHFFDSTARWLREDRSNRFTLVVDELHTYRGTAGTEVALLLRNLTHRLGIAEGSDQLRILAASASLDPVRDRGYLQDFFGVAQESFEFLPGRTVRPEATSCDVSNAAAQLASTSNGEEAVAVAERTGAHQALFSSFYRGNDDLAERPNPEAKSERCLRQLLFPHAGESDGDQALGRLLEAAGQAHGRPGWPRLRSHLFFRNVPGVWACTDPGCDVVTPAHEGRTVGRLYSEPATRCECGARVLELLYCQNCGDVMLGGFVAEGVTQRNRIKALMLADIPEISRLPDQVRLDRTAGNYLMYWPRAQNPEVDDLQWTADSQKVRYAFERSVLDPASGKLESAKQGQQHTGWSFHVRAGSMRGAEARDPFSLQPFPTVCPNCGDDWEIKYGKGGKLLPHTDQARQRSPIRGMRTGFEKINQLLVTELASQLPEPQRKLIVFADSRQDAAKLSAGLDLRHYQDLLRILLYEHVSAGANDDLSRAKRWATAAEHTPENSDAVKRLKARDLAAYVRLTELWSGVPEETPGERADLEASLGSQPSLRDISAMLAEQLLAMGINPGGPAASLTRTAASKNEAATRWSAAYDWSTSVPRIRGQLGQLQLQLVSAASERLENELIQGLFSGAGRDFESLGLGWLALASDFAPIDAAPSSPAAIGRASLRVLADLRRFQGLRDGRDTPHKKLRNYWQAVADNLSLTPEDVQDQAMRFWGAAVVDYVINPGKVVLRAAPEYAWTCPMCRRQHLHRGTGLCTRCRRALPADPAPVERTEDYYAWKAVNRLGRFRMHCAELTGQTDREDAQSRQARFQGVFLNTNSEEDPRPDAVDLLSVTTTMEAGVDIGALEAVVLGNMPPTRFNYQQRVGRAGRRSSPVAVALTVCRGRSHDEYYFERPELITNEPTPKPYLALGRQEIIHRSLRSEVLRRAFNDLRPALNAQDLPATNNVHGQFGLTENWQAIRPMVQAWLDRHPDQVRSAAEALSRYAPEELRSGDWATWIQRHLAGDITEAVNDGAGHADLSQRLADAGKLPMFGFPTRVRYLHLRRPQRRYPWPPPGTIDRDLAIAVSQFAPMSEVVRDGQVYPVVGVTAFRPIGARPQPETEPLGPQRLVAVCRACSYVAKCEQLSDQPRPCPRCSAAPGTFTEMQMREPLGFRAGFPEDFDGNFSWSARAMSAKAMTDLERLAAAPQPGMRVYSGPGTRYILNDNGGRLYRFAPAAADKVEWGGWVSVDAIERGKLHTASAVQGAEGVTVALGAVQPTDFLFAGPAKPVLAAEGLRLNLVTGNCQPGGAADSIEGRRAAWYSLAFLLRTVASVKLLDVQELELGAGIFTGIIDDEPTTMAFLSDTLENGAGFCTHLGSPAVFPDLMDCTHGYLEELRAPRHARECTASCYRCLRDYSNMAYHALLDWRLAADLLTVLRDGKLTPDSGRERKLLGKWAEAYRADMLPETSAPAAVLRDHPLYGTCAIVARHPLEAAEQTLIAERLAQTAAELEVKVPSAERVVFADTFTLDRNPAEILELLDRAGPQ